MKNPILLLLLSLFLMTNVRLFAQTNSDKSGNVNAWSFVGNTDDIYNSLLARVGIGLNNPNHKLHLEDIQLLNQGTAQKINFGTELSGVTIYGLDVNHQIINFGATDAIGVNALTSASYFGGSSDAGGQLAVSKAATGADFIGVNGYAVSTFITGGNPFARIIGGSFKTLPTTNLDLGNEDYWIAGMKANLEGNFDNNPVNGAVAAIIGRDLSTGTTKSWAGYFEGDGYFSEQVIIGKTIIPTMANFTSGSVDVSNFQLFVEGGILTEKLVLANCTDWADYVFASDYRLLSLEEVENHIDEKGHLPNTPSAAEISENGLDIEEITIDQQEKIEELFLHVIELNKQIKALQMENAALKSRVQE